MSGFGSTKLSTTLTKLKACSRPNGYYDQKFTKKFKLH